VGVPTSYGTHPGTPMILSASGGPERLLHGIGSGAGAHLLQSHGHVPMKPPSFVPEARRQAANPGSFVPLREAYPGTASVSAGGQVKSAVQAGRVPRRANSPVPSTVTGPPQRQSPSPKRGASKQRGPQPLVTRPGVSAASPRLAARQMGAPPPSSVTTTSEAEGSRMSQATEPASEMTDPDAGVLPPKPCTTPVGREAHRRSEGSERSERSARFMDTRVEEEIATHIADKAMYRKYLAEKEAQIEAKDEQLNAQAVKLHSQAAQLQDLVAQVQELELENKRLAAQLAQAEKGSKCGETQEQRLERERRTKETDERGLQLAAHEARLNHQQKLLDDQRRQLDESRRHAKEEVDARAAQLKEHEEWLAEEKKQLELKQRQHMEACQDQQALKTWSQSPRGKENQEVLTSRPSLRRELEEQKMRQKEIKTKGMGPENAKVPLAPMNWVNSPA